MPRIQKWGNSLGVRIPKPLAEAAGLAESAAVTVSLEEGAIVIRPDNAPSLRELLSRIKPGQLQGETDFGVPVGKEVW